MATTVNTIHRSEQLFGQLKKLPSAGRKMLDAFVRGWMRFAASAAKHGRRQQFEEFLFGHWPIHQVPQARTYAVLISQRCPQSGIRMSSRAHSTNRELRAFP
jgi:hypothetical protein